MGTRTGSTTPPSPLSRDPSLGSWVRPCLDRVGPLARASAARGRPGARRRPGCVTLIQMGPLAPSPDTWRRPAGRQRRNRHRTAPHPRRDAVPAPGWWVMARRPNGPGAAPARDSQSTDSGGRLAACHWEGPGDDRAGTRVEGRVGHRGVRADRSRAPTAGSASPGSSCSGSPPSPCAWWHQRPRGLRILAAALRSQPRLVPGGPGRAAPELRLPLRHAADGVARRGMGSR